MTVNNLKQKIRTIDAKALFKYFPKSRISFIDENYYDALNQRLNLNVSFRGCISR